MNDNPAETPPESPDQNNTLPPVSDFDQEPATQAQAPGETVVPNTDSQPFQQTVPTNTTVPQTESTLQPVVDKPKLKSKKPLVAGIIVAVLLALFGGGAAMYALWYQNPERIVGEAMMKLVAEDNVRADTEITSDSELAPGFVNAKIKRVTSVAEYSTESGTGKGDVSVTLELNGRDYDIGAKGLFSEDHTVYFQIIDVKELVVKLATDMGGLDQVPDEVQKGLENLQNRWVKVNLEDLTDDTEAVTCIINTAKKIAREDKYANETEQLYMKHKFIEVGDSVGTQDGNLGYKVKINQKTFGEYVEASQSTEAAAEFKKCPGYEDSDFNTDNSNQIDELNNQTTVDLVVWVSRFGHELKQIDYTLTAKNPEAKDAVFTGKTKLSYDEVDVKAPEESVDLETWQNDFQETINSATEELYGPELTPANQEFTLPVESTT